MKKIIRLKYVLPRLIIFAFICLFLRWGLSPLIRTVTITTGEAAVGAKVEVGEVTTSLLNGTVSMRDVAVANPKKPFSNLFTAEEIYLQFDRGEFLRRRFVVNSAKLKGVQFDTTRETSDELEKPEAEDTFASEMWGHLAEQASTAGASEVELWLDNATGAVEKDFRSAFESPQLAETMAKKWPKEYEQIEIEIRTLRNRGKAIEKAIRAARNNPLRHLQEITATMQEMQRLERDAALLATKVQQMQPRLQADRAALENAKANDIAKIKQQIELGNLKPQAVSEYLLSREVSGRVGAAIEWVQFLKRLVSTKDAPPENLRGQFVLFAGQKKHPKYLIRSMGIDGRGTITGEPFELVGTIFGLTNNPKWYGKPTVAKFSATGPANVQLVATFDRTQDNPIDHFTIDCPNLPMPAQTLGKPTLLAVQLEKTLANVHGDFFLEGDKLRGRLHISQTQVVLTPKLGGQLAGKGTEQALQTALQNINQLSTTIDVSGTLNHPEWKLDSNLGEVLASGIQRAGQQEIARQQEKLAARLQQELDKQIGKVTGELEKQQAKLLAKVDQQKAELIQIAKNAAQKNGLPVQTIGRGLRGLLPR